MENNVDPKASECIVVLGMHRSGNSLMSGCLHCLGYNLGDCIKREFGSNGNSVFENQDIVLAHEILFRDLGCRWDMVGSLPEGWEQGEAAEQTAKKLIRIIERQFLGHGPWVVKDPRICRLMPIWQQVFKGLDLSPKFVHMLRHPYEVASSLHQHNSDMALNKGHLLWLVYNGDAMRLSHGYTSIMLTYDQLLADPIASLLEISNTFNLSFPTNPVHCSKKINEFVRAEYKHHHAPRNGDKKAFSQYAWVYEQFKHSQLKSIGNGKKTNVVEGPLSELTMLASVQSPERENNGHVAEMFNQLLSMIGDFERTDFDEHRRRQRRLLTDTNMSETLYVQVFFPQNDDKSDTYTDKVSKKVLLAPNEWQEISWDISRPIDLRTHRLRIDPLNTRGSVSITSIKLVNTATKKVLWLADEQTHFDNCTVSGDGIVLSEAQGLRIICTGDNTQLLLPELPDLPDCPIQLKVWINVSRNQAVLHEMWPQLKAKKEQIEKELKLSKSQIDAQTNRIDTLEAELKNQKALTEQYFNALIQAEQESQELSDTVQKEAKKVQELENHNKAFIHTLDQEIDNLTKQCQQRNEETIHVINLYNQLIIWMKMIKHDLNALKQSRRYRLGNAMGRFFEVLRLKSRNITAMNGLEELIAEIEKFNDLHKNSINGIVDVVHSEGEKLVDLLMQLESDYKAFSASRRWRLGNAFFRTTEILLLRPKNLLAMEQMKNILSEFNQWLNQIQGRTLSSITPDETKQLNSWFEILEHNFNATLASRRWRLGSKIANIANVITLKSQKPIVTSHMKQIFDDYRNSGQTV